MIVLWDKQAWIELTNTGRARMRTRQNVVFDGEWFEDDFGHRVFACDNGGTITIDERGDASYRGPMPSPESGDDPRQHIGDCDLGFMFRESPSPKPQEHGE